MDIIKNLKTNQKMWDIFTRKEEYYSQIHDRYDRFSYYSSEYRNIFEPCVSEYLIEHGFRAEYPENKPFAVCLTHDVDVLYKTKRLKISEAWGQLRNARFSKCISSIKETRSKKLPWWNFSDIMALENQYDAKSSFYFMVQDQYTEDYNYEIEDCEAVISELSDNGWEIGLHGGYFAYTDPVIMRKQKTQLEKVLNKNIVGYRNHYLQFKIPDTWEHLHSAGFQYDATFGYADCIGFRNGMCHPFKPYNLTTQSEIDILEIPLNIMDDTLNSYMKFDLATSWEMTKQLIDTVEQYHGVITLLWHNHILIGEQRKFYEKILKYCAEKNAWMTTGKEITRWVNQSLY
jgi:peptidoglycan/xylan/chitin deacetylase (PgdA/CDA1 family)